MPVKRTRQGNNIIYTIEGPFNRATAEQYLDMNAHDYNEIGDAIGAVIDIRPMGKFNFNALRVIQERLKGVVFDTPVAFVGNPDGLATTFLRGIEALTSRGRSRFAFFTEINAALTWVDAWFVTHHKDRQALIGVVTTTIKPGRPE